MNVGYYVLLRSDGDIELLSSLDFASMSDVLNCSFINIVHSLTGSLHRLVVDDAFWDKKPLPVYNFLASYLYSEFEQPILGDAILCREGFVDGEPDVVGFEQTEALRIVSKLKRLRSRLDSIQDIFW